MYDRRPTSRAARGTLTVAAPTPVVCGSCQLAILSPLRGRRARSLSANIVERPPDFKRNTTNDRLAERLFIIAPSPLIADFAKQCDIGGMARGSDSARLTRAIRAVALVLAVMFSTTVAGAPPQRIIAVGDLHGDF